MTEDFTSMNNPKFLYLAEMHQPFPDWVVKEAMPEKADFEKKSSTAFADPKRRLLPICTKSAAFHSAINMFARPDDYDEETLERVKEACAHYGIEQEILPYAGLFVEEFDKSAALDEFPEGRFAIDTTLGGEKYQLLPLNDAEDVSTAAFDLAKMASEKRIHFMMMIPAAREIVKAANDFGVEKMPEMIIRYGVPRFADAEKAAKLIEGREQFCKEAGLKETVTKDYQEALAGIEEDPDGAMEKIATIDHLAGVETSYKLSAAVPNPFDIVFSGLLESDAEKAATEHVMVKDVFIPLDEVKRISSLDAQFRLSKEASETFSKLRDTDDARDLSIAIDPWVEDDKKTFLRLAVEAAA